MNLRHRLTLAFDDSLRRVVYGSQGAHFVVFHRVPFGKTPQAESSDRACTGIAEARKFLQLVEGEHSFLGAVVVENPKAECRGQACLHMTEAHGFLQLLVLELEVFELGTEHQAGREAGP